ncbi:hypothetical protein [Clostridium kluyveri]|uniref:DUF2975 domain-containing protein n=1 Tax=Clostridium kluyveri TaxID=1534 RepID=A0A1L5F357_CLOKL|nr:hypothetical protein [Clostridium kluyveri]APM37436.1 hypothetical protein BS101_00995 [Clostridium kluyveri]UZQ48511.1 hypothetical protein OP486_10830 [Clostridium kluyveri]
MRAKHEIETTSVALQIILAITSILTIIAEIFSIRELINAVEGNAILTTQIKQVIYYVFFIAIQLVAFLIFHAISKNKTPFLPEVSRNIKIIGGLIMFSNAIAQWTASIISSIMSNHIKITIIDESVLLGLLLGLIFACLGAIFDYGCVLQKQDDETL